MDWLDEALDSGSLGDAEVEDEERVREGKQAMRIGGKGSCGDDRSIAAVADGQISKVDDNVSAGAAELDGDDEDWAFPDDENSGYISCVDKGAENIPEVLALIDENQLDTDRKDHTGSAPSPTSCGSESAKSRSFARQFSPGELKPVSVLIARNNKMAISVDSDSSENFDFMDEMDQRIVQASKPNYSEKTTSAPRCSLLSVSTKELRGRQLKTTKTKRVYQRLGFYEDY
eukprot:g358.t1